MSISKVHRRFAELVSNNKALNRPQDFLGPNTTQLLKFWSTLDTLTEYQLITINEKYWDFYRNHYCDWDRANDEAKKASDQTIGRENTRNAGYAVMDNYFRESWFAVIHIGSAISLATKEIIGNVENPAFLPMFDNL